MRNAILAMAIASLASCRHEVPNAAKAEPHQDNIARLKISDVSGKAFEFGTSIDYETCYIETGCDCCTSDFVFIDSKTCIIEAYCLEGNDIFKGSYRVVDGRIEISYGGSKVLQESDESQARADTTKEYEAPFTAKLEQMEHVKIAVSGARCASGKLILKVEGNSDEYGAQSDVAIDDYVSRLKQQGIWQLLFR